MLLRIRIAWPRAAFTAVAALSLLLSLATWVDPAGVETRDIVHTWRRVYYGVLDGQTSLLFADGIERAKPALGDLDGDGDLDLIVGTAEGRLLYFENQGSNKAPRWHLINEAVSALPAGQGPTDEEQQPIFVGANAAPALVDIDGDGDLDLFVGSASGKLYFYRNVGNAYLPVFRLESTDFLGQAYGQNLVPKFGDVNADGLPDLALGNEAGEVWLLTNSGTRQTPRYCENQSKAPADCIILPRKLLQLAGVDNAVPEWVDWNRDGIPDLMVGKSDGTIDYWVNIGTRTKPDWELKEPRFDILDIGGYAAPLFADLNGDGMPDLLLAGDRDQIALYFSQQRQDPKAGVELWIQTDNALEVHSLAGYDQRAHVATGDLFGNGRQDLVVGTASGQILVYENLGGKEVPTFRTSGPPVLPTPQRGFTAPAVADVDGDGLLDIVVGDRNGHLEWIKNAGTKHQPVWRPGGLFFGGVSVGSSSVPLFADLDGDGLQDLLVGNGRGQIVFYRNTGTATAPRYTLAGTRFANLSVTAAASPALFPWNPPQPPDVVTGSQDGSLIASIRNPTLPVMDQGAFQPQPAPWGSLRARGYSAPAFADLTGAGKPFLLLGTGGGRVLLWRYEGNTTRAELAKEQVRGLNTVTEHTPVGTEGTPSRPAAAAPTEGTSSGPTVASLPPETAGPRPVDPVFVEEPSELNALPVGRHTKPVFFDVNGDGRPDLIVGNADGKLLYFENQGPSDNPKWKLVTDQFAGFHYGRNAAPTFADVDGTGRQDLIVGTEEGMMFLFENAGPGKEPRFVFRETSLRGVRAGKNAVPVVLKLEAKEPNLLAGSLRGGLQLFRRKAGAVPDYELSDRRFLGLDLGVNTSPSAGDLTQTGHTFLLIGTDKGPITVLEPTGTSPLRSSGWRSDPAFLAGLKLPPGSHPALVDLDGDGDLDLVVGSDKGPLVFFRNNAITREASQPLGNPPQ